VVRTQELANQAVVLEGINDSRLNDAAALFDMAVGVAMVIVQKRMDQRQPYSKDANGQKSEPVAGSKMYHSA
jgi:hypothetical protein